jgi:hypothetical protein
VKVNADAFKVIKENIAMRERNAATILAAQ